MVYTLVWEVCSLDILVLGEDTTKLDTVLNALVDVVIRLPGRSAESCILGMRR